MLSCTSYPRPKSQYLKRAIILSMLLGEFPIYSNTTHNYCLPLFSVISPSLTATHMGPHISRTSRAFDMLVCFSTLN